LTARVEGISSVSTNITSYFRRDRSPSTSQKSQLPSDIPFREDFESVIARSDKLVQDIALSRTNSRASGGGGSPVGGHANLKSPMQALALDDTEVEDESAIAMGDEGGPTTTGLYHRRQSMDISSPSLSALADDTRSIRSESTMTGERSEKNGWMKGDLTASRSLIIHANPSVTGGVSTLDVRKEGFVAGLNSWRLSVTSEAVRPG
jgi:hypothetical protein